MREVVVAAAAWKHIDHWQQTDVKILARVMRLIGECRKTPFTGIGKPEPLKGEYAGYWSRRITDEHRLVYRVTADQVRVMSARYHYER